MKLTDRQIAHLVAQNEGDYHKQRPTTLPPPDPPSSPLSADEVMHRKEVVDLMRASKQKPRHVALENVLPVARRLLDRGKYEDAIRYALRYERETGVDLGAGDAFSDWSRFVSRLDDIGGMLDLFMPCHDIRFEPAHGDVYQLETDDIVASDIMVWHFMESVMSGTTGDFVLGFWFIGEDYFLSLTGDFMIALYKTNDTRKTPKPVTERGPCRTCAELVEHLWSILYATFDHVPPRPDFNHTMAVVDFLGEALMDKVNRGLRAQGYELRLETAGARQEQDRQP